MRKKKAEEHVSHERWLVSYADFITLLFAFFTTLYAISTVDAQKMGKMVLSMRASFDGSVFAPSSDRLSLSKGDGAGSALSRDLVENVSTPKDKALKEYTVGDIRDLKTNFVQAGLPHGEVVALSGIKRSVESKVNSQGMAGKVQTRIETRGLVISLGEGGFFDSGSDQLKPEGRALLDALAPDLVSAKNEIRIEGHTDNVPIQTWKFPSNMELSTARAAFIYHHLLQQHSFAPEKLSASGYAEFRPIASNDTPDGRARNRRIDIVILSSSYSRGEPR
jgi:chemotaxis protein MotB